MNGAMNQAGGTPAERSDFLFRPGNRLYLAATVVTQANELHRVLRAFRDRVQVYGPQDASEWAFIVRIWETAHRSAEDGLELISGSALAARYAWARAQDIDYRPQLWTVLGHQMCPVRLRWEEPGLEADRSLTCRGAVTVGDTAIGRLTYVVAGAIP
jgi:hypothetical protein